MNAPHLSYSQVRLAVAEALLEPGLAAARLAGMNLDELLSLVEVLYVREHQRRGMSWAAMMRRLQRSRRSIATLVKRSAERPSDLPPSPVDQRRVLLELRDRPLTLAEVESRTGGGEGIGAALEALQAAGLVENHDGEYRIVGYVFDIQGRDPTLRLDALRHFLDGVLTVVYQHFFASQPAVTFAKTVRFRGNPAALHRLADTVYRHLEGEVLATDEEGADEEGADASDAVAVFALAEGARNV